MLCIFLSKSFETISAKRNYKIKFKFFFFNETVIHKEIFNLLDFVALFSANFRVYLKMYFVAESIILIIFYVQLFI